MLVQVKEALAEGADIDVADGAGHTALSEAATGGQLECLILLMEQVRSRALQPWLRWRIA